MIAGTELLDRWIAAAVKLGAGVLLREFRRHAQVRWLTPLGGLFCAGLGVIGLVRGELVAGVESLGVALLAVVLYGREVRSIDVGSIGLVLRAPFRSRVTNRGDDNGPGAAHAQRRTDTESSG